MESPGACPGLTTPQQRRGRQSRGKRSLIRSSPEDSGYDSLPPTPDKQHVALDGAAGRHRGFHDGIAYYLTRGSPIRLDRPGSYHTDPYYAPEDAVDWACSAFYAGDAYYLPGCSVDARCPKFLDGNRSSRGAASDSDEIGVGTRATRDDDADKPVTLPRPIPKPRHSLPAAFFTDAVPKSPRRSSDVRPSRATPAALRQPDRFVPHRDHGAPFRERFLTTKHAYKLGPTERILRNDTATPDAFTFRPRRVTPTNPRVISRSDTGLQPRTRTRTVLAPLHGNGADPGLTGRTPSHGSVWTVGGIPPAGGAINNGRGALFQSGTSAPLFRSPFPRAREKTEEEEKHKGRLAAALEIDLTSRVLEVKAFKNRMAPLNPLRARLGQPKTFWNGAGWVKDGCVPKTHKPAEMRSLPVSPFKVLDAPHLRDDFYCSILAYSAHTRYLAVGLGNCLYAWREDTGVMPLNGHPNKMRWLTSLAWSSNDGKKGILAFGRSDHSVGFISLLDSDVPRMAIHEAAPIACLSFRPTRTIRPSRNPFYPNEPVSTEDLVVGDEVGTISYYVVEWPAHFEVMRDNWPGEVTLMARILVHRQQICGLAWSNDAACFASGGNDNLCCLFEVRRVLRGLDDDEAEAEELDEAPIQGYPVLQHQRSQGGAARLAAGDWRDAPEIAQWGPGVEKRRWEHGAAVKAIAFCPWQDGLVATGGGSNDKCVHFWHATSGAALATISVSAQVTSLIWSTTRREIAATFGYAQPDHPIRVAVFSWPECRQVAAIPWEGEHRALYAVPFPSGPPPQDPPPAPVTASRRPTLEDTDAGEFVDTTSLRGGGRAAGDGGRAAGGGGGGRTAGGGGRVAVGGGRTAGGGSRAAGGGGRAVGGKVAGGRAAGKPVKRVERHNGCIVIAASDETIKFHEVWGSDEKAPYGGVRMLGMGGLGMLGGSDILEDLEGIDKEGDVIR